MGEKKSSKWELGKKKFRAPVLEVWIVSLPACSPQITDARGYRMQAEKPGNTWKEENTLILHLSESKQDLDLCVKRLVFWFWSYTSVGRAMTWHLIVRIIRAQISVFCSYLNSFWWKLSISFPVQLNCIRWFNIPKTWAMGYEVVCCVVQGVGYVSSPH